MVRYVGPQLSYYIKFVVYNSINSNDEDLAEIILKETPSTLMYQLRMVQQYSLVSIEYENGFQ